VAIAARLTERIYEIATELVAQGGLARFDIDALAARAVDDQPVDTSTTIRSPRVAGDG
jgi:hypothetical protein